jgi:hypothetical protein
MLTGKEAIAADLAALADAQAQGAGGLRPNVGDG